MSLAQSEESSGSIASPGLTSDRDIMIELAQLLPRAVAQLLPRAMAQLLPRAVAQLLPRAVAQRLPRAAAQQLPRAVAQLLPGGIRQLLPPGRRMHRITSGSTPASASGPFFWLCFLSWVKLSHV